MGGSDTDDAAIRAAADAATTFTADELAQASGQSVWAVLRNLTAWRSRGEAEKVTADEDAVARWKMVVLPGKPKRSGAGAQTETVLWDTVRLLGTFTAWDVKIHIPETRAQVTEDEVRRYLGMLLKAGYLKVIRKAIPGQRTAKYRLIKNTGPLPPVERRTVIVQDPNLDQTVYVAPVRP
jgi:hypothetical protein